MDSNTQKGQLFVVALPIGNLRDITFRALDVLQTVEYIACEDTRTLKKLLSHYGCSSKKLISFYKDVEKEKSEKVLKLLEEGIDVALVSEAGSPIISDPGSYLVREAYKRSIKVIPIPGPSALTCALSASGIQLDKGFIFLGFLPRKKQEQKKILESLPKNLPIVIFEAPHRINKTLKNFLEIFGNRDCFFARELTKIHEELLWTDLQTLSKREEFLGEITLIIMPEKQEEPQKIDWKKLKEEVKNLKADGLKHKEIAKILAKKYNLSAKELYNYLITALRSGKT
ncbi:16S rRNA (cytidine(1402)-2'-O)-methyltransferase [Thermodesulfobacterium hydrogeniphilum]|uniref:16S rRNA (cytidine(1402)-2'-O)-methyltransferase n=1 Tax=Thermodesulfobacterium hydrogeniphilum TaxID=161156 RepID=UPI00056DC6A0|nr:16S rRNA (cytidine(1402)-2'-O)-methyltransferase [Thermodesulfobacterium hydrogeniphilum]